MFSFSQFSTLDGLALALFALCWLVYGLFTGGNLMSRPSLNVLMNRERENWMRTMSSRELRVIDTSILAGLQQGTAFFASTSVFAIGGCFALMNASDQVINVSSSLPVAIPASRALFENKAALLLLIYSYAFFKFGWSYRLQNYCSILVGAVPLVLNGQEVTPEVKVAATKALKFNNLAGTHFNAGLRAISFRSVLSAGLPGRSCSCSQPSSSSSFWYDGNFFPAPVQRCLKDKPMASELELEEAILATLRKAGPGKPVSPQIAAVSVAGKDEKEWRKLMTPLKLAAKRLAVRGEIELLRRSKPVPVEELRGLYKMRLPIVE